MSSDPLGIVLRVASAMEACGLRYLVGGSLASSLDGEPRSTLDVDIVVSMKETDIACLLSALGPEFYVDETAVQRAVQRRSSVNRDPSGHGHQGRSLRPRQAGRLDRDYLRRFAEVLGVRDLVDRVLSASSSPP